MDARIISAFAHASILLPGIGIFVPVVLWSFRKKYSNFVRNQALQTLIFQLFQWIWIQLITLFVFMSVFTYASISTASHLTPEVYFNRMLTASILSILTIVTGWMVYQLFGVIGAVICLTGRSFKYPLIGHWIAKYVSSFHKKSLDPILDMEFMDLASATSGQIPDAISFEDREDRLVAAAAHGSILILVLGFLAPLILAMMDKEKSLQNRFQVLQALLFQGIGQVIIFVLSGCQLIMAVSIGVPMALFDYVAQTSSSEPIILGIGLLIIFLMAINVFILLITPLLATLGIIASVQVLRGKQYHYPILGRWLAKKMSV